MNRNGKLAIGQIAISIISLIIGIVLIALVAAKAATATSPIVATLGIVTIVIGVASLIVGILQITFGAIDKMWIGMTAGILVAAAFGLSFIGIGFLNLAFGIAILVLNIITIVKSK